MRPNSANSPSGIFLEADEIIVKPLEVGRLTDLVREKMLTPRPTTHLEKEGVGVILQRCVVPASFPFLPTFHRVALALGAATG
jgi:hypothetical protein